MNMIIPTIAFIILNQAQNNSSQSFSPISPCPKIFQYQYDGNEWFGNLVVKNLNNDEPFKVKLTLSLLGKLKTDYLGEIQLLTRGKHKIGTPIAYKVKFPKSNIPPRLQEIYVNDQIVCSVAIEPAVLMTQIHLEHTREFTFIPNDMRFDGPSSTPDSEIFSQANIFSVNNKKPTESAKEICGRPDIQLPNDHHHLNFDALESFTDAGQVPIITLDEIFITDGQQKHKQQHQEPSTSMTSITRGAWPWLAAIYVNNSTSLGYQCSGTLVSSRIVISAAHCFHLFDKVYNPNEILVFLGRNNLKDWNEEVSLAVSCDGIFIHPDYDNHLGSYDADVAVLMLRKTVSFNRFIRPACLWSGPLDVEYIKDEHGVVVSWGTGTIPKLVSAPIQSNDVCFKFDEKFRSLSSNRTICAGKIQTAATQGLCAGDSGAGLMILKNSQWILRGIVSASLPIKSTNESDGYVHSKLSCNWNRYVIYTDVAKFLDWIYSFAI